MSYLRYGSIYKFVDGTSKDYIFCGITPKVKKYRGYDEHPEDYKNYIEDYGSISNESIVELIWRHWETEDKEFKEYMLKNLAKRLNVKLRKKPLTDAQSLKLHIKNHNKWLKSKEYKEIDKFLKKDKR